MIKEMRLPLLVFLSLFVVGCQLLQPTQSLVVPLGHGAQLRLLEQWPNRNIQQLQQVTWSHPKHSTQTMLVSSVLQTEKILIVGLSPIGQELWRVSMSSSGALEVTGIEPFDQPELAMAIVADMQLQLWPLAALSQQLSNAQIEQNGSQRTVTSSAGKLLWQAIEMPDRTVIENINAGYSLTVKTLEESTLSPTDQSIEKDF